MRRRYNRNKRWNALQIELKQLQHDYSQVVAERDCAVAQREQAIAECDEAIAQREMALSEREDAIHESDEAKNEMEEAIDERDLLEEKLDEVKLENEFFAEKIAKLKMDLWLMQSKLENGNVNLKKLQGSVSTAWKEQNQQQQEQAKMMVSRSPTPLIAYPMETPPSPTFVPMYEHPQHQYIPAPSQAPNPYFFGTPYYPSYGFVPGPVAIHPTSQHHHHHHNHQLAVFLNNQDPSFPQSSQYSNVVPNPYFQHININDHGHDVIDHWQ